MSKNIFAIVASFVLYSLNAYDGFYAIDDFLTSLTETVLILRIQTVF